MRICRLALVLLLAASPLAADTPCARAIGGRHIPAFAGLGSEGLDFQRRCLAWEYSAEPKAEFIPAPEAPSFAPVSQVVVIQPAPNRQTGSQVLSELLSRSLSLKPANSGGSLSSVAPGSDAQPPAVK
jgi:hypothetical protein